MHIVTELLRCSRDRSEAELVLATMGMAMRPVERRVFLDAWLTPEEHSFALRQPLFVEACTFDASTPGNIVLSFVGLAELPRTDVEIVWNTLEQDPEQMALIVARSGHIRVYDAYMRRAMTKEFRERLYTIRDSLPPEERRATIIPGVDDEEDEYNQGVPLPFL